MRILFTVPYLLLAFWPVASFSDPEAAWLLRREAENIQVYTRAIPGSDHDEVLTTTVVGGLRLSALVALLQDAEACPDWAPHCASAYVVAVVSEQESYVYTHSDMPFPVRDRDVVSFVSWQQDPVSRVVTMVGEAVTGVVDEVKGRVRLTDASAVWTLEPLPEGRLRVSNRTYLDPGSRVPAWLTNQLLVETPLLTMQALISLAQDRRYRGAEVSFVTEPDDGWVKLPEPGINNPTQQWVQTCR